MTSPRPRRFHRTVDGILLLDKPLGLSSNEALQRVRGLYGALKAGHGGSLDPLASGVLPVALGIAARWPAIKITTRQLLALKPGEILDLSPELAEKVELRIGQLTKFNGRLGTHQNKWAIQITEGVKSARVTG